jgi:hypothetical protein
MRQASSPLGSVEFRCLSLERIPVCQAADIERCGCTGPLIPVGNVAMQHEIVNGSVRNEIYNTALRKNGQEHSLNPM